MGYSEKCLKACEAIRIAEERARQVMRREYPIDSSVLVKHSRGQFYGVVVQHCWDPAYMVVVNDQTGKRSKRWFREVERR